MKGLGFEKALEEVKGLNAVTHIMSGNAISCALRGLNFIEVVLMSELFVTIIRQKSFNNDTDSTVKCSKNTVQSM